MKGETAFSFPSLSALELRQFLSSSIRNLHSFQLTAALRFLSVSLGKACGWERFSETTFYLANITICDFDIEGSLIQGKTLLFRLEENVLFYRHNFRADSLLALILGTRGFLHALGKMPRFRPKIFCQRMTRPKPETAHEKPLATWLTSSYLTPVFQ